MLILIYIDKGSSHFSSKIPFLLARERLQKTTNGQNTNLGIPIPIKIFITQLYLRLRKHLRRWGIEVVRIRRPSYVL